MNCVLVVAVFLLSGCASFQAKKPCDPLGYQHKRVAFVMDQSTAEALERYKFSFKDLLIGANWVFGRQGIPIRYNVEDVKVIQFDARLSSAAVLHDLGTEENRYRLYFYIKDRLKPILTEELTEGDSDIVVVLSNDIGVANGAAVSHDDLFKVFKVRGARKGKGLVLVGTWEEESSGSRTFGGMFKPFPYEGYTYMRELAYVIAHEQAHLYGVPHSEDKNSLMYYEFLSLEQQFDPESLKILQNALRAENQYCASTRH